jgi:Lsr2
MRIMRRVHRGVVIDLVDDLDGTKAEETITFGLDGKAYEIELSELNARDLRLALTPFVERALAEGSAS